MDVHMARPSIVNITDGIGIETVPPERSGEVADRAEPIYREVYARNPKKRVDWFLSTYQSPESIREQILSGTVYGFIVLNGERIGYVAYEKDSEGMRLSKLYLLKEYRGKGIGGIVLDHVEEEARKAGIGSMHLEVNQFKTRSQEFYTKHGYAESERMDDYRIIMRKSL